VISRMKPSISPAVRVCLGPGAVLSREHRTFGRLHAARRARELARPPHSARLLATHTRAQVGKLRPPSEQPSSL
jgi:hypothetical protein